MQRGKKAGDTRATTWIKPAQFWAGRALGLAFACALGVGLAACPAPEPSGADAGPGQNEPDAGNAGCVHACETGDALCSADGLQTCEADANGCRAFSAPSACPGDTVCSGGACVDSCTDVCSDGETRCSGDQQQACVRLPSGCWDWDAPVACDAGVCMGQGVCADSCTDECSPGDARCTADGRDVCAEVAGCALWRDAPCADGETCDDGACEAAQCDPECPAGLTCRGGVCTGAQHGIVLNETPIVVSGSITVNGAVPTKDTAYCSAPDHARQSIASVRFVDAARGYDVRTDVECQDSGFDWSTAVPPGTYRVTVERAGWSGEAGVNLLYEDVVVREGLVIEDAQTGLALDEVGHTVSGSITVNGAAPTKDAVYCSEPDHARQSIAYVRFVDMARGYDLRAEVECQDSGFDWSTTLPPGDYRVTVERAGWSGEAGVNLLYEDVVVRERLVVDGDQSGLALDEVGHAISGSITLNGAMPTRDAAYCSDPDHARQSIAQVRFVDVARGYDAVAGVECQDGNFDWDTTLPPGAYRVTVERAGWSGEAGVNLSSADVVVREAFVVDGPESGVMLDERVFAVSGVLQKNGQTPTRNATFCAEPSNATRSIARARFVDVARGYDLEADVTCADVDFTWSLNLPEGTYRVTVERSYASRDADVNLHAADVVVREGFRVNGAQSGLVLSEVTHNTSGTLTLNDELPTRDAAYCADPDNDWKAIARVRFVDDVRGYDIEADLPCNNAAFTWSRELPTGSYRVSVERTGWSGYADVNLSHADVVVRENFPVMSSVNNVELAATHRRVSGSITVNGAVPLRDSAYCSEPDHQRQSIARVRFVDSERGYDLTRAVECQDPGFDWELTLPPGTYRTTVEPGGWTGYADVNIMRLDYVAMAAFEVPEGYDPVDAGQPDAGQPDAGAPDAGQPDAGAPDAGMPDAGAVDAGQPDAGAPDAGQPDAGMVDQSIDFNPVYEDARGFDFSQGFTWFYKAHDSTPVLVRITNYESYGGPTTPGVYPFTSMEESFTDCGLCVIVETQCTGTGSDVECQKEFMPIAGTGAVRFTELGTSNPSRFAGSVSGTFREVTINGSSSTVVPGGDIIELQPFSFDADLFVQN